MPTIAKENYLKAIYSLGEGETSEALVSLGEVARRLEVTPGTVTVMVRGLHEQGLVDYQARRGVRLTEAGRQKALQVLRRHRLVELFLVQVLGMDWSEVHDDAEALEHVISDRLLDRIDALLDYPTRDPHGAPIPNADSEMPARSGTLLSEVDPGSWTITRVVEHDPEFLSWLDQNGLHPGCRMEVLELHPHAGLIRVRPHGHAELAVGMEAARRIRVH